MGSPWSRLWSSRACFSLLSYSSTVPLSGRWAMTRTPRGTISVMYRRADGSRLTLRRRISSERSARERLDTSTMPTMKNEAILIPSGRSTTLVTVV